MESRVWEVCSLLPFAAWLGKEKKAIVIDLLLVAAGS